MDFVSNTKLTKKNIIIIVLLVVIAVLGGSLVEHMANLDQTETELKNIRASYDMFLEFFCDYQLNEEGLDECWEIEKFGDRP